MKTYKFNGIHGKIKCSYFFNSDCSSEGIDISVNGRHIGECYDVNIPDEMDDEEYLADFEKSIEEWLDSNY